MPTAAMVLPALSTTGLYAEIQVPNASVYSDWKVVARRPCSKYLTVSAGSVWLTGWPNVGAVPTRNSRRPALSK